MQRLRYIEPGTFMMGSPENEPGRCSDEKQHKVTISNGYWIMDTPVTQGLWSAVMVSNQSHFRGPERPVENVSWHDCQEFIRRINSEIPGLNLSLPTEAQWEYACRAGTTTPFYFGDNVGIDQVNYDGNYPSTDGEEGEYRYETICVKALPCNALGLYQMHGNVSEWCQDWYGKYSSGSVVDPVGHPEGRDRVFRGGSWFYNSRDCRSAYRFRFTPDYSGYDLGFRLSRGQ